VCGITRFSLFFKFRTHCAEELWIESAWPIRSGDSKHFANYRASAQVTTPSVLGIVAA
jgi:hypothetical protein